MSKALLIVNTKKDCVNCILCNRIDLDRFACQPKGKIAPVKGKPDWCPLRLIPEKRKYGKKDFYDYGCVNGWNDALNAIKGSGNND